MFVRSNDKLDYSTLEQRVSIEIVKISEAEGRTIPSGSIRKRIQAGPGGRLEGIMVRETKRRSFPKKVAAWFKAFFKLYRLRDQAALGVTMAGDVARQLSELDTRIHGVLRRVDERLEVQLAEQRQGIARDLQKKLDEAAAEVAALKREIMFQQRRLTRLTLPVTGAERAETAPKIAGEQFDSFYVAFEDVFRGTREDIKGRLARYLELLRNAGAGQLGKPVLDVGCGRGEWLELLKENHILAYGVDLNGMMVERTVALGLEAYHADVIEHLRGLSDMSLSALTGFHIVEHLPFEVLIDFLDEALRVLTPGGIIMFETPNPETIRVGATTFYNDPTHRNPIPPQVLQFMVEHRGFEAAEILRLHPFTDGLLTQPTADAELLNRVLFGPQDYAVVARRS